MDTKRVVSAMGAVLLLAGSLPAIAQDYYPPDRRGYEAGRDDRGPPDDRHRWVRDPDGNFLLVAIASGVITNLLLNAGHHGR